MRTIKFRGKKQNGEWVYGSLLSFNGVNDSIYYQVKKGREERIEYAYVHPRTVGQFTGLIDKNGKEIYEGDVVSFVIDEHHFYGIIKWGSCRACFFIGYPTHSIRLPLCGSFELKETLEVIGNIHDNPELLNSL